MYDELNNDNSKESVKALEKEFRKNDNLRDDRLIKDTECKHEFWTKRCSFCKTILESDSQVNYQTQTNSKRIYTEFDSIVCSHTIAKQLKQLKICQKSKLYWIETKDFGLISLRSRENVSLRNQEYFAAFTSQELCRHFYRILPELMTAEVWDYIGKNAVDPNRLGRLLVKLKKEHEHRIRHR